MVTGMLAGIDAWIDVERPCAHATRAAADRGNTSG
jgi:hypothetical protein